MTRWKSNLRCPLINGTNGPNGLLPNYGQSELLLLLFIICSFSLRLLTRKVRANRNGAIIQDAVFVSILALPSVFSPYAGKIASPYGM